LIVGVIVLIVCLRKKKGDGDKNDPIVNVEYNKNEIKLFDVEKNISSKIIGEDVEKVENKTFNYFCILGVKDKLDGENPKNELYDGFFAILNTTTYNEEKHKYESDKNEELLKILNKKHRLFRNIESYSYDYNDDEDDDYNKGGTKPFLKVIFYRNETYKEILRPYNLSDSNFNEMKELLDLVLPKIVTKGFALEQSSNDDQIRKENLINIEKAKIVNRKNNKNHIQILRVKDLRNLDENEDNNGYSVKDKRTNDNYYIENKFDIYTDLIDGEEEKNQTKKDYTETIDDNLTKYNNYIGSGVYSDLTKYRGSDRQTNISSIIDESQGDLKEIFARTYMNLSKQEYLKQTDKKIYNEDNYIKDIDIIDNNNEIYVTNHSNEKEEIDNDYINNTSDEINEEFKENDNNGSIYNMLDANFATSVFDYHIIVNSSFLDENIIEKIYSDYLNKFKYQSHNFSNTILNRLKSIIPLKDRDKYKIIEGNEIRALEESEKNDYYGLKKFSRRKDFFQTNFLGLDISLGLANTYNPSTGEAFNAFKIDIGDFKLSQNIKSFSTNEPIITENIQQMGFKLLRLMHSTHLLLEKLKNDNSEKINETMKYIINSNFMEGETMLSNLEDFYELLAKHKKQYQDIINAFHNNLTLIKNYKVNLTMFNNYISLINDNLNNFNDNSTSEINSQLEDINTTISVINQEIENNKNIGFHPYLYEDYRAIIQKINNYFNIEVKKDMKSKIKEIEILYEYQIKDRMNELMNTNIIVIIQNLIEANEIFDFIYSEKEKDFILSYLNDYVESMKKNMENNLESISLTFNKSQQLEEKNDAEISNTILEMTSKSKIIQKNFELYEDLDKYFGQIDKIDESTNDIIALSIKGDANHLFNNTNNLYESINEITFNLQNK
jgi:hypothetical protein